VNRPRKAQFGEVVPQKADRVDWSDLLRAGQADAFLTRCRRAQFGNLAFQKVDLILKLKGKLVIGGESFPFDGELVTRPGERDRLTFTLSIPSVHRKFKVVDNDVKDLVEVVNEMTPAQFMSIKKAPQTIPTGLLVAPLGTWSEKMELLGESDFGDLRVIGMRRAVSDSYDVAELARAQRIYYFDKETGYLLKVVPDSRSAEIVFSGHTGKSISSADETTLKQVGLGIDAESVVTYLKKQSPDPATTKKIKALIVKLGEDEFAVREQATKDVVAAGPAALPLLDQATKSHDLEVVRRAQFAAAQIRQRQSKPTVIAAVRVLTRLKPANATEVLLNLLSGADEEIATEARAALAALAHHDGKPDSVLVKALTDKDAAKRAAAEAVLGIDGGAYLKKPGRRLYPENCRFPAKVTIGSGKSTFAEIEIIDVQLFNRLDDRVFEKP
jgi:hypothetical protein